MPFLYNLVMGMLLLGASLTLACLGDREVGHGATGDLFPVDTDEAVGLLMEKEMDHRPNDGYVKRLEQGGFESSWRKDAIDWICKVHSNNNFGPLSLCLSVNYLDRFLASFNPLHDKSSTEKFIAVACLSLAVKMEETIAVLPIDFQVNEEVFDANYEFGSKNIKMMELLVLDTLKWRMRAVTPFSFMRYFLDKFNEGKAPTYTIASRCAELIVNTVKDSRFVSFRPSEIAATMVLSTLAENHATRFNNALAASEIPVNKDMIVRCYELMWMNRGNQSPHSPIDVLDAACFSSRSDGTPLGSSQSNNNGSNNDQDSTLASKRRRLGTTPS
ncbi:cyclin-D2-2 isoform X1 [Brachypodium distachyon]|uniref:Uncharacterized protein n=1 Tax=Brachypodium distachyon TaxID=15368 RepID=I1GS98_BRADI|nr:cyclin-D2-2 isoform X1 [Brachypodium distachyon]KQK15205.1 hypothetical protein BRADI_1g21230v3 [Brachypodium distachyon]|eukprot:XP_014752012.1 cyclin-D2-2 isoform X1 [Brachypodium distachyon]